MTTALQLIAQSLFAKYSDEERARIEAAALEFAKQLADVTIMVGQAVHYAVRGIENAARRAECGFERAQLLEVYRKRGSWKKGDLQKLRTYPLNRVAQKRLGELARRRQQGRPTIRPHRGLAQQLVAVGKHFHAMFDPATPPMDRLRLLKRTRWWAPLVEATYRGEYARLKAQNFKGLKGESISSQAEREVAQAFVISVAELKRLRNGVRKDPRFAIDAEAAMMVEELEYWKETGSFAENRIQ